MIGHNTLVCSDLRNIIGTYYWTDSQFEVFNSTVSLIIQNLRKSRYEMVEGNLKIAGKKLGKIGISKYDD